MSIKDIIDNIKYAKRGLAIDVRNPWEKQIVEEELKKRNITFAKGFFVSDSSTVYALTGGTKEELRDFVKWYMSTSEHPKHYINRHKWFKTKILTLVRE